MKLNKIEYKELTSRQKEIYNFQKVAAILADYGFNCIKLSDDWQGADFLAYHKDGENTLRVQLKSRLGIAKKYCGKNLCIAFPLKGYWYLIEHDELIAKVGQVTNWLNTKSWIDFGSYSSVSASAELLKSLEENKLEQVEPSILYNT
jgi:hypothetical protein